MKKISFKIMLAIIICSITTSTVLCVFSINKTSALMTDEVEKTLSYASEKYSNQLSIYFKNTEGLVEAVAANVTVTFDPVEHQNNPEYFTEYKAYLDRIIRETLNDSDIAYGLYFTFNPQITAPTQEEVWYAYGADGIPVAIKPNLSLNSRDFSEPVEENMQYYFKPILKQKGSWTGPYVDPDVYLEMLSYSRAVYVNGVLVGVAGADILTDDTIDIVKTMKLYDGSSSFLFDEEKNLIVSSQDTSNVLYAKNEMRIKNNLQVDQTGLVHYSDARDKYILAYSRLSNNWIIGIAQPTDEVFSETQNLIFFLAMLTAVSIVLTIIFGFFFAKKFSKPIMSASDQLKLLGMGDYTHDIPKEYLERKDDLGEFHNAIQSIQMAMKQEAECNREKDILMIYQSKQAKIGEMVGNISHQWKQPLNTINLILMNLYDDFKLGELSEEQFKNTVDRLMNIVKTMSETIKDFTDFLKPNREMKEFDLQESLQLALDLMETSLKNNAINVQVNLEKELRMMGYPNEFSHVLFNILNNARDAIVESDLETKEISILGFKKEKETILEIRNSGHPIPPEVLGNIFEPYYTTKADNGGTGIGLYISKIIVEQRMMGRIEIENTSLGVCCRIFVPSEKVGEKDENLVCGR